MSITTLTFGREFTAAIEAKQVAAQEAERAKFVVEKAEQDKKSAIIRAEVSLLHMFRCSAHFSSLDIVKASMGPKFLLHYLNQNDPVNALLLVLVMHEFECSLQQILCFEHFLSSKSNYSDSSSWPFIYQGEATSAKLIGQAIANNPAFITLRKIEAAREIASTISNSANKVYLNSDDLLLNLQEMNLESTAKK